MNKQTTISGFIIKTMVEISEKRILDLLVGAFEGGSNYWVEELCIKVPGVRSKESGVDYYTKAQIAAVFGEVRIKAAEDDKLYTLNRAAIQCGLEAMALKYHRHFADIVDENDDATTSDVLLQMALFKEIIYG